MAGVEDGSFEAFRRSSDRDTQYTLLCLAVLRGPVIQEVKLRRITVDGRDSTDALLSMLTGLKVEAVILGGVTFAGFNVVDAERVYLETAVPVIVYSCKKPDMEATLGALRKHFRDWRERWRAYDALGDIHPVRISGHPVAYYECVGCSTEFAEKLLADQALTSRTPEALRVADMVAKGLSSAVRGPVVSAGGSSGCRLR